MVCYLVCSKELNRMLIINQWYNSFILVVVPSIYKSFNGVLYGVPFYVYRLIINNKNQWCAIWCALLTLTE